MNINKELFAAGEDITNNIFILEFDNNTTKINTYIKREGKRNV